MKKFSWLLACIFTITVSAQDQLIVMGKAPDMYVVYTANGTESLQAISNGFGLSVTKLSTYNNSNINSSASLAKGTQVKVPFTKDNLLQQQNEGSGAVVHIIKKGENLYRISQAYNKVPVASLREWNHLKTDAVKDGQRVIIGFMVNAKPALADKKIDRRKDINAGNAIQTNAPAPDKIYTEKKQPPVPAPLKQDAVISVPVNTTSNNKVADDKPAVKEIKKKEDPMAEYSPKEGDEGYFAAGYSSHGKDQTQQYHSGDAATFKTISGWTDRKYYVLMNDVAPRTIVRITGPANKNICAMVLGPLQETRGANGLLLRLSNSAASALGVNDPKFTVTVTYFE